MPNPACVSGGTRQLTPAQVANNVWSPPAGSTVAEWVAKSRQESSHYPECVNSIGAVGLWQIRDTHWRIPILHGTVDIVTSKADFREYLKNPANNFTVAKYLFEEDKSRGGNGWTPWRASGGKPTPNAEDRAAAGQPDTTPLPGSAAEEEGFGFEDVPIIGGPAKTAADTATAAAEFLGQGAEAIINAGKWLSNRDNWSRIAVVVLGGAVFVGAMTIVAKPAIEPIVKTAKAVKPI